MKRLLSIAFASLACASAMAQTAPNYIWGVRLYSNQVTPQSTGNGIAGGICNVDNAGLSALQATPVTAGANHDMYVHAKASSTASVTATVALQVYWYGSTPPSTLYINETLNGSANYTLPSWVHVTGTFPYPVGADATASGTSGPISISNQNGTDHAMTGLGTAYRKKPYTYTNRRWVQIALLGAAPGVPLWKLVEPTATDAGSLLNYSPPGASVTGSVDIYNLSDSVFSRLSMSNAGTGLGYTVSTLPVTAYYSYTITNH